ncbi:MAG: galactose mutarotase [Erysipelotrichaceae bacterium]|nr:galactose mutarotase [Erysipelotrichaceae bacterium]
MKRFGEYEGREIFLSRLENEYIKAEVFNYGASLRSFTEKQSGRDVVLGFDSFEPYTRLLGSCLGATVGRYANRIGNARFVLNGKEYLLPVNNGPNCLHGGLINYSQRVFKVVEDSPQKVIYRYRSPDGEEGFPGNLDLWITYELDGPSLLYKIEAECDQDSVLNVTNHSYFNLETREQKTVLDQEMRICSNKVALADPNGMASPEILEVAGTAFDYREFHRVGDAIEHPHPNMEITGGIDHNYLFEDKEGYQDMAVLRSSELELAVGSDLPGLQVYTANFLSLPDPGKDGFVYEPRTGICFEGQFYPNAVNYEFCRSPVIRKDERTAHLIRYTLTRRTDHEDQK